LEARATGLPVVAMKNSAVADFIVDGESGILVDDGRDYAARVAELALDSSALSKLRAHNTRVPVPFDWDSALARHLELYERVAAGRAAA
jgi:glycosyltransferase involved in cell wall biosynthesis